MKDYENFTGWIISRGREAYENMLKNPDYICSILEYEPPLPLFGSEYEEIFNLVPPLAAVNAYEKKCDGNINTDYQTLDYHQEFLDSLVDEKKESTMGILYKTTNVIKLRIFTFMCSAPFFCNMHFSH